MKYRRFLVFIFSSCILTSCHNGNKTSVATISSTTNNSDSGSSKTIVIKKPAPVIPFGQKELAIFKLEADSIITAATHKKKLTYILKVDTLVGAKTNGEFDYEYFGSDSLVNMINMEFSMASPNKWYSFEYSIWEYTSDSIAYRILDKVTTISYCHTFGLTYTPDYIFRIGKKLYWLFTPNTLEGKYSYGALVSSINKLIKSNYHFPLDTMENHLVYMKGFNPDKEGFSGKWRIKYECPIILKNTSFGPASYPEIVEFKKDSLKVGDISYFIRPIYVLQLPDFQTFLKYLDMNMNGELSPQLNKYKGKIKGYMFSSPPFNYFQNHGNPEPPRFDATRLGIFKLPGNRFGFINENSFYIMEKVH